MEKLIFQAFSAVGFLTPFLVTSGAAAGRDFTGIFEEPQGLVLDGMAQLSDPYVEFRNDEITLRKDDQIQHQKTGKTYAVTRIRHAEDGSYSIATLGPV